MRTSGLKSLASKKLIDLGRLNLVHQMNDSFHFIPGKNLSLLLTCEHASQRLPPPWKWPHQDNWLIGTHWSHDLGSEACGLELAELFGCPLLLSRFSRLLIDPNRPLNSNTLFRETADGKMIFLNQQIKEEEKKTRINLLYKSYHEKLQQLTFDLKPQIIVSLHSFTPVYESNPRHIEIGVLYNQDKSLAQEVSDQFRSYQYESRLNEPWSGRDGFMYAVENACQHSKISKPIMLEFRQDLLTNAQWRTDLVSRLYKVLSSCLTQHVVQG